MFFKHNSREKEESAQQVQVQLSDIVNKFNQHVTANQFIYPLENEKDFRYLIIHIQSLIEEANETPDKIYHPKSIKDARDLDTLVDIGFFDKVRFNPSVQQPRTFTMSSIGYKCLFTNHLFQDFLELRQKMQDKATSYDNQYKIQEIRQIHEAFDRFKANATLMKAINNSKNLLDELSGYNIEILATPMEPDMRQFYSFTEGIHKRTYFGFRPRFFDCGLAGSQELESFESLKRLDAFICANTSYQNTKHDFFSYLLGVWGAIQYQNDRPVLKASSQREDLFNSIKKMFTEQLTKVNYLFDSLLAYGLIESNSQINRFAFNILLYDAWYEKTSRIFLSIPSQDLDYINSADLNVIIPFLREKGLNDSSMAYLLAMRDYLRGTMRPLSELTSKYQDQIKSANEEMIKKQYVEQLLKGGPVIQNYTIEDTDHIEPYRFEELIATLYRHMGYEASVTKKSGDQGVDIIASKGSIKIAIQAKCYPNSIVGNSAVQAVVAGMRYYQANEACVVTNSTFTQSANELAKANNVVLWDREKLQKMLEQYPISKP